MNIYFLFFILRVYKFINNWKWVLSAIIVTLSAIFLKWYVTIFIIFVLLINLLKKKDEQAD